MNNITKLTDKLSNYNWFDSVGIDDRNRLVVYIHSDNSEVMKVVPDTFEGQRVISAFALSKPGTMRSRYVNEYKFGSSFDLSTLKKHVESIKIKVPEIDKEKELDINYLITELSVLKKICGHNILESLFYEIKDRQNALTNLAPKFPDVYEKLFLLYEDFGFDVIYDELND